MRFREESARQGRADEGKEYDEEEEVESAYSRRQRDQQTVENAHLFLRRTAYH